MSTEQQQQPVDPSLLDQTRQQIRSLVSEIETLVRSDAAPQEFYAEFLNRVVQALAGDAGAIWIVGEGGRLELAYQINLRLTKLADRKEDQEKHGRLLRKIVASGEGTLEQPYSGDGDGQSGNPTEYLLVLGALRSDQEVQGIIEVFQRPNGRAAVERGYLRFLLQMCDLAGDYLKTHHLRLFSDRQVMWTQLEQFTRLAHQDLNPRTTSYTIANEGRRLIECDRVTVAVKRGNRCRVEAISGQETFERRSNTVTLLDRLASVVVAGGEPVWYSGDTSNMPPQIEEAVEQYVDESHTKAIAILPLAKPNTAPAGTDEQTPPEWIGALIVEQITEEVFTQGMMRRIEVVRDHSASALSNSIEHHSLFLMPVWRTIGKSRLLVRGRALPKTLVVVGLLLGTIAAMFLIPADFELHARGTLEPVLKRDIFAGVEGTVVNISNRAEQGTDVTEGEPLITLENSDLANSITELVGRIESTKKKITGLTRQHSTMKQKPYDPAQLAHLESEIAESKQIVKSYQNQYDIAVQKSQRLVVASPLAGTVLTWKASEKLIGRPVEKGQVLLSVADPTGDWELELKMPEDRMGHIVRAQRALREANAGTSASPSDQQALTVEYIVATDPGNTHYGTIREIHSIAEVHGEDGNVVLIRVTINKKDITIENSESRPRPGATVTAKIHCGRTSLGYSLFHDLVSWFQSRVLFRF